MSKTILGFGIVMGLFLIAATIMARSQVVFYGQTGSANSVLSGTTSSIGGTLLALGSCSTGTATVTGATTSMVATANPTTYQGDGLQFQAYVSSANTVTVKICAILSITPPASTYKVRVFP